MDTSEIPKWTLGKYQYEIDRNGAGKVFLYEVINLVTTLYGTKFVLPMISTTNHGRFDWCGYDYDTKKALYTGYMVSVENSETVV